MGALNPMFNPIKVFRDGTLEIGGVKYIQLDLVRKRSSRTRTLVRDYIMCVCDSCGENVKESDNYCRKCGVRFTMRFNSRKGQ